MLRSKIDNGENTNKPRDFDGTTWFRIKRRIMITMKIKILNRFIDNIIPIKPRE
jgi:hypothetical protein